MGKVCIRYIIAHLCTYSIYGVVFLMFCNIGVCHCCVPGMALCNQCAAYGSTSITTLMRPTAAVYLQYAPTLIYSIWWACYFSFASEKVNVRTVVHNSSRCRLLAEGIIEAHFGGAYRASWQHSFWFLSFLSLHAPYRPYFSISPPFELRSGVTYRAGTPPPSPLRTGCLPPCWSLEEFSIFSVVDLRRIVNI